MDGGGQSASRGPPAQLGPTRLIHKRCACVCAKQQLPPIPSLAAFTATQGASGLGGTSTTATSLEAGATLRRAVRLFLHVCGVLGGSKRRLAQRSQHSKVQHSTSHAHGPHKGIACPTASCLQYTLLIYLSSCEGGETIFYGAPPAALKEQSCGPCDLPHLLLQQCACSRASQLPLLCAARPAGNRNRKLAAVAPRPGLALLHKHGEHCLDHEAAEVKSGIKYVLRSDVVFQRRR